MTFTWMPSMYICSGPNAAQNQGDQTSMSMTYACTLLEKYNDVEGSHPH
jgi:hypothetical protein